MLGLSEAAQAQGNVALGLKAGGSYSTFDGQDATNAKSRFGFHAGVFANISLSDLIAVQPELVFSQKGAKYSTTDALDRLNYLDIPLSFHLNVSGLFFEAGPQVGVLLGASRETGSVSVNTKERYNDFDFGYLAGLGYQRKSGPGIGLRYNGGFTNVVQSTTAGSVTTQPRIRNSVFQLYLTYSFGRR
ncbi:porin family protein [Hymenobacter saemangeumensis]|uniref:Porin family protein n=2 Tax=Hymenobacter saemangeumensis TaxID=1084522 RepID=A0ABP8IQW1_9BACT